jgi:DNA invertase Pin-like site-specific DNA recombinase
MKKLRVALYARVSTRDKQDPLNQLSQLRDFCQRQGWDIVTEYVDRATGKKSDRAEFQRMFAAASERQFDLVLFWSLDRFSREGVLETLQHLQRLRASGVDWWSLKEEFLRSVGPFADAILAVFASIAKQERVRLSERVTAGLERARREGRIGGRPRLVVDRQKVEEMDAEGFTMREIACDLGISAASVCRILKTA